MDDENILDVSFQSSHIVAHMVEGLANVFQPTENEIEDTLFKMVNATSHYTKTLPGLVQKMKKIQTLMAQM